MSYEIELFAYPGPEGPLRPSDALEDVEVLTVAVLGEEPGRGELFVSSERSETPVPVWLKGRGVALWVLVPEQRNSARVWKVVYRSPQGEVLARTFRLEETDEPEEFDEPDDENAGV
ncbi:MAG: hypothetical protein D6731_21300 [Planctomycetota bacterium]|nr:MAG: hypothetical protein D6731_21300 [Planctomycetota bacterium]